MQSIAPDTIEIEVTKKGVEIGGYPRAVGWHGPVTRTSAKALITAEKAKVYAPEAAPAKDVEQSDAVGQTADQQPEPVLDEDTETSTGAKRVPRSK